MWSITTTVRQAVDCNNRSNTTLMTPCGTDRGVRVQTSAVRGEDRGSVLNLAVKPTTVLKCVYAETTIKILKILCLRRLNFISSECTGHHTQCS